MRKRKKGAGSRKEAAAVTAAPQLPGRSRVLPLIAFGAVVVAGALFAWSHFRHTLRPGQCRDCNILFVTLDTTRADHLPAYGYTDVRTPALDALVSESSLFEDAVSQAPLTLPSHISMMTGRLTIAHGVYDNAGFTLDPKEVTLAEEFKAAGYTTAAFVSSFVLESRWQLNQGFDTYFDHFNIMESRNVGPRDIQRRAEDTERIVSKWLDANRENKFFLWVHFYDPHDPYDPPEPFKTEYAGHLYDGEIAYTDQALGRLLDKVHELGIKDRTVVIVAGDHGEGLGDHQEDTHGMFLYRSTLHVPLILHVPKGPRNRVKGVVSLIDIAPTLLEIAGIPPDPNSRMQGVSLLPVVNGTERGGRSAYSESMYAELHYGWSPLESLTTDDYKYIKAPRSELYDRNQDPDEKDDLFRRKESIAKVMGDRLEDIRNRFEAGTPPAPEPVDSDTQEKLAALGYIGRIAVSTPESLKIDPKDKIQLARRVQLGFDSVSTGYYQRALNEVGPVMEEDPNMIEAYFVAGAAYIGLHQPDPAIDALAHALSFRPTDTQTLYNLGYAFELKGNLNEAEAWYRKVMAYEPNHLFAALSLGRIYRARDQPALSRQYFQIAIQRYETALKTVEGPEAQSDLYVSLGGVYYDEGDLDGAQRSFLAAAGLTPSRKMLYYNLAQIYEARGEIVKAVESYQQVIRLDPASFRAFNNLGLIYKKIERFRDAALCFERVIELNPREPRGYILLSQTYQKMGQLQEAERVRRLALERNVSLQPAK